MRPISADSHVVEGPEVFAGLADRFGDEAPRVVTRDDGSDHIVTPSRGARGSVNVGMMALAATRLDRDEPIDRQPGHKPGVGSIDDPEIQAYLTGGYAAMRAGLTDGASRGDDQDLDGLDAEVLYPGFFSMFSIPNVELLVALQKNYNDWLHDHCAASGGRLVGLAALPVQDPEAALSELVRIIDLGYRGAILPSNAPKGSRYCDREFDAIWATASEAGIPLSFHVGCSSHTPRHLKEAARERDSIAIYAGAASLIHDTLIDLLCHGVCQRHPELQFVVAEFNAGWLAHWLERVDQGWKRAAARDPDSPSHQPVGELWQRQFFATIEDDQPALLTRALIGEDRLMWGSDYPHTDSTWPCSAAVLDEMFADVPDDTRQRITRDTVRRLYGL